ncbi:MAG: hypothetical protein PF518_15490 [Spirochaetaceae bacterium]|jgi:hypothetical protein|nr:hypothetical protein [Spirochaetaceae bacterium]
MKKKIIIIFLIFSVFNSCKTMSIEERKYDYQLIFYPKFYDELDETSSLSYVITLTKEDLSSERHIKINNSDIHLIKGIGPGNYKLSYQFMNKSNKLETSKDLFRFNIKETDTDLPQNQIIIKMMLKDGNIVITDFKQAEEPELLENWTFQWTWTGNL